MQETSMGKQCLDNKTKVCWNFVLQLYKASKGKIHILVQLYSFYHFSSKLRINNKLSIDRVKLNLIFKIFISKHSFPASKQKLNHLHTSQ